MVRPGFSEPNGPPVRYDRMGVTAPRVRRPVNDPRQYDDLADQWWQLRGPFAGLHWLAGVRAALIPAPSRPGAPLLDVACGAGLLAPRLPDGWRHVGLDLSRLSLVQARAHGVAPVQGDALRLPFADAAFDCVVAGEALEHFVDLEAACGELARVLAPGGTLVLDTMADTLFARLVLIRIAGHVPGGPPPGFHSPDLLVDARRLRLALAAGGVRLTGIQGLRPSVPGYLSWLLRRRDTVRLVPTRRAGGLYQALGRKAS